MPRPYWINDTCLCESWGIPTGPYMGTCAADAVATSDVLRRAIADAARAAADDSGIDDAETDPNNAALCEWYETEIADFLAENMTDENPSEGE